MTDTIEIEPKMTINSNGAKVWHKNDGEIKTINISTDHPELGEFLQSMSEITLFAFEKFCGRI